MTATEPPAPPLGRLQHVDLRTAWISEAGGFTPWLAREENLALLGGTIGTDLELETQEQSVGPFRADILCKDIATNHWVLIENQLERTDHIHLGQLLTYAAGLDAVTIVWIAAKFTDEHRAALDWLNEKTSESVNFFGLEIELWRIADSPPAPKFNIVSKPNDWSATIAQTARGIESGTLTPTRELQQAYWQAFVESLGQPPFLRPQSVFPQDRLFLSAGRAGFEYMARVTSRATWIQVALSINDLKREAAWFPVLLADRERIDEELGYTLDWDHPRDGYKENRMAIRLAGADFHDRADWPRQHEWLRVHLEKLHRVFDPRLQALPPLSAMTSQRPLDMDAP